MDIEFLLVNSEKQKETDAEARDLAQLDFYDRLKEENRKGKAAKFEGRCSPSMNGPGRR
jgi:hypothetical protein